MLDFDERDALRASLSPHVGGCLADRNFNVEAHFQYYRSIPKLTTVVGRRRVDGS